jgi:hypothetical protein
MMSTTASDACSIAFPMEVVPFFMLFSFEKYWYMEIVVETAGQVKWGRGLCWRKSVYTPFSCSSYARAAERNTPSLRSPSSRSGRK